MRKTIDKNNAELLKKILAGILVGAFLFTSTISWAQEKRLSSAQMESIAFSFIPADNDKLAPPLRSKADEFRIRFLVGEVLLSHKQNNAYIKSKIDGIGYEKLNKALVTIKGVEGNAELIAIPGLLKFTGLLAHAGLGRYYGKPVIYIDSDLYYDEDIRQHEFDKVSKWEALRKLLGLEPQEMRKWILDNIETPVSNEKLPSEYRNKTSCQIAEIIHKSPHRIDRLYKQYVNAVGYEYLAVLTVYDDGGMEYKKDITIAAHKKKRADKTSVTKSFPPTKKIEKEETASDLRAKTPQVIIPTMLQSDEWPTFSFQFKSAKEPRRILEFVTAHGLTKMGFADPDIFQRYMGTLIDIPEPRLNDAMMKFLRSEYGEKFIKALARLGINNLIIDVIHPHIWDDYDYAFAVRNIIPQYNTLYVSIPYPQLDNAEDRHAKIASWLVLPMRHMWESRWGHDTLTVEGVYFQKDNPIPVLSAPKIPEYFCFLEMLRRGKVLPEQICLSLQGQAYSKYLSELKTKSQNLSQDELAAMLWDQLEEGGEPINLCLTDKHTSVTCDIRRNVTSPDFRLRSEQPEQYAHLIQKPSGIELRYIVKSWDKKNEPFLRIDASTFFKNQIAQPLSGLNGKNLADAAEHVLAKIYGFDHDLCCRLIGDAVEADVLKFTNDNAYFVDVAKSKNEEPQTIWGGNKGSPSACLGTIKNDASLFDKALNKENGIKVSEVANLRPYHPSTVYKEFKILKDLGIFVSVERKRGNYRFSDMMIGPDENYTKTLINAINDIRCQVGKRGEERPLHRWNIPDGKTDLVKELIKMTILHRINLIQKPAIPEGKVLWHILEQDIVSISQRSSFTQEVNNAAERSKASERIYMLKRNESIEDAINHINRDHPDAIFDIALSAENHIGKVPGDIKRLVFKGSAGDVTQLEGIVAALRALHGPREDVIPTLKRIYAVLKGAACQYEIPPDTIDDPVKFARNFIFDLPPTEPIPADEISKMNERLLQLLVAA